MTQYIHRWYDYDFCKNVYSKNKLSVYDLHGVINKIGTFNLTFGVTKSIQRYKKYKNRGFIFTNMNNLCYKQLADKSLKFGDNGYQEIMINMVVNLNGLPHEPCNTSPCHENCVVKFCGSNVNHKHAVTRYCFAGHYPDMITIEENNI